MNIENGKLYEYLMGDELLAEKESITSLLDNQYTLNEKELLELEERLDKFYYNEKQACDRIKYEPDILKEYMITYGNKLILGEASLYIDQVTWSTAYNKFLNENGPDIEGISLLTKDLNYYSQDITTIVGNQLTITYDIDISSNDKYVLRTLLLEELEILPVDSFNTRIRKRRLFRDLVYHKSRLQICILVGTEPFTPSKHFSYIKTTLMNTAVIVNSLWQKYKISIIPVESTPCEGYKESIKNPASRHIAKIFNRLLTDIRLMSIAGGTKETKKDRILKDIKQGDLILYTPYAYIDSLTEMNIAPDYYDTDSKSVTIRGIDSQSFLLAYVSDISDTRVNLKVIGINGKMYKIYNKVYNLEQVINILPEIKNKKEYLLISDRKPLLEGSMIPLSIAEYVPLILPANAAGDLLHIYTARVNIPFNISIDGAIVEADVNPLNWEPVTNTENYKLFAR